MKLTSWLPYVTTRVFAPLASAGKSRRGRRYHGARLAGEMLETRALLAAVVWDGFGDGDGDGTSWNDPLNWVGDELPVATDDVMIGVGFSGIVHSGGSNTVNSITSASPFTLSGGTLTVSTTIDISSTFSLAGGTLENATTSSGTTMTVDSNGLLNGVTLNGDVNMASALPGIRVLTIVNGLTLNGTAMVGGYDYSYLNMLGNSTLDGTGDIVLGADARNAVRLQDNTTLTIGAGITIHIQNGGGVGYNPGLAGNAQVSVINNGTIAADTAGGDVTLRADWGWINNGVIEAVAGATLSISGSGTNNGTITASGGGTVTLVDWINNGVIEGLSGSSLSITNWTNNGTITEDGGGTASLGGSWINNNTLGVSGSSSLNLSGSGTWAATATALTTDAASTVQFFGSITANGGTLDFGGGGLLHLFGGTLINGVLTMEADSRLELSGGILNNFTITNHGAATWTSGNVTLINGSAFNNAGTFDDQTDGTFGSDDFVCPTFTNSGTFIKSGGTGVTQMKTDFLNSGLVEIQQGILNIGCGYVQTGGSTVVTGGAITGPVEFQGGSIEGPITGDVINSGEVSIPPSTTPTTTSSYTQSGLGSLTEQIGGTIPGIEYGQIQVTGNVNLAGNLYVSLIHEFRPHLNDEFLIINKLSSGPITGWFSGLPEGSTVWAGVYGFEISYVGGDGNDVTLNVTHSPIVSWDGNTDGDGDGTSWNDPLNWSGDVLPGPNDDAIIGAGFSVTHSATVTDTVRSIESHGQLTISGGTLAVTSASIFTGDLTLSGGTLTTAANIVIGDLVWTSGTLQGVGNPTATVTGAVDVLGDIDLCNMTFDLTQATLAVGTNHLSSLRLEGATMLRAESWTIDGMFQWMDGTLDAGSGLGSLIANGGMAITGGNAHNFAVTNNGDAVWSDGNVTFIGNSNFTNSLGASFDDQTDGSFGGVHPACPIFYNEGIFTKSGGDGITDLEMELHNRGEVRVERGTLILSCGYVQAGNGTIGGGGGAGGTGGTVTVADFQQSSSGILIEQIAGTAIGEYGQIIVTGNVSLAGTLGVELLNGFTPNIGNTFVIIDNRGSNEIQGTFASLPEGSIIPVGIYGFVISYVGGTDLNDVVLTSILLNEPPTAVAGGPYFVPEGGSVVLDGSGSSDHDPADTLTYEWDFDGDGDYDATGISPTFSAAYLDGPSSYTIRLRVTDNTGAASEIATTIVNVTNATPLTPVDTDTAPNEILENSASGTVGITAFATDPGSSDTVTYSLSDDAGGRFTIDPTTGVVTVANGALLDYEAATSHTITVEASDGQGGSSTQSFTINLLNQTATISGTVFVDADGDGLFDGGTETAIDAVMVELYGASGGLLDTDLTELGGVYAFIVDDEYGTYRVREIQPTGVSNGAAILGSAGGDVISSNEMRLTLNGSNASEYDFTEAGQAVQAGDTASIGFWQNKNGQALIKQGGSALVAWLNTNFANIFGNTFSNGSGGDNAIEVANFYKNEFFKQKLKGTPKVDAQFMATALATFFTSSNLSGGTVAACYGFHVTQTGAGTKVVNVHCSGAAFGVTNNTNMTIMSLLLATNDRTGARANSYSNVYDMNGDGVLDNTEKALRVLANTIYSDINEAGHN